jgi:hypothetical protein
VVGKTKVPEVTEAVSGQYRAITVSTLNRGSSPHVQILALSVQDQTRSGVLRVM